MATEDMQSTGIFVARREPKAAAAAEPAPAPVELIGHVRFVERASPTNFDGMRALLKLCDPPGTTVVVITPQLRLQSLLESALSSGNLIACVGTRHVSPLSPRSRAQGAEIYFVDSVILYSSP